MHKTLKRCACLFLILCLFAGADIKVYSEEDLSLGNYITLGRYNGEPILWRYVADDENGKLFLSDKILRYECFGISNAWETSWVRTWLNSSASSGNIDWGINAPEYEELKNTQGFLSAENFSESEKSVVKSVNLRNVIEESHDMAWPDAGYYRYYGNMEDDMQGLTEAKEIYNRLNYNYLNEKFFLLDVEQFLSIKDNSNILGSFLVDADATASAISEDFVLGYRKNNSYWLRTPYNAVVMKGHDEWSINGTAICMDNNERSIPIDSYLRYNYTDAKTGIRPAFYLNEETACVLSGGGTKENPYEVEGSSSYEASEVFADENTKNVDLSLFQTKTYSDGEVVLLEYFGNEESIVIPDELGITKLKSLLCYDNYFSDWKAFTDREKYLREVKSVILPDGLHSIGSLAFKCCESIESITIPASVTEIKAEACYPCKNLKEIHFEGNDYPNISSNIALPSVTIYYNDWATGFESEKWSGYPNKTSVHGVPAPNPPTPWENIYSGAVVELGSFNGNPIKWNVAYRSGNNYILLCSDVLTEKEFDVDGVNTWETSSLRKWLNSTDGFLSGFSKGELLSIVPTGNECILTEKTKEQAESGSEVLRNIYTDETLLEIGSATIGQYHDVECDEPVELSEFSTWENNYYKINDNFELAYKKIVTDRVWLPREDELASLFPREYVKNGMSPKISSLIDEFNGGAYWLRSPYTEGSTDSRYIDENICYAHKNAAEKSGIRPMICVNADSLKIISGYGTKENPLRFSAGEAAENKYEYSCDNEYQMKIDENGVLWAKGKNEGGYLGIGSTDDTDVYVKVMEDVKTVSLGAWHSLILKNDGTLWTCGCNWFGELGDSSTQQRNLPVKIMDNVKQISAGRDHSAAVTNDGSLYCWGANWYGQAGSGTNESVLAPVKVLDGVDYVRAGTDYTLAVKTDGSFWTWGKNDCGQLMDGTTQWRNVPKKIRE